MSLIKGENCIFYVYDDGQWKPIICARSGSFNTTAETIETSITGTGVWRTYEYTALTWTATVEGLIYLDGTNELTASDLRAMQYSRTKILLRFTRTDTAGNVYTDEGNALITGITDSGDLNSAQQFSVELKGTGPLTIVYTPTPIDPTAKVKRLEYTGTAGETFFTSASLIGRDILEVVIDGISRSKIITAGTPVDQEAKYTSGTGRIDVPIPLVAGTEVYVLYQDI
jgi:predicted secreted protein